MSQSQTQHNYTTTFQPLSWEFLPLSVLIKNYNCNLANNLPSCKPINDSARMHFSATFVLAVAFSTVLASPMPRGITPIRVTNLPSVTSLSWFVVTPTTTTTVTTRTGPIRTPSTSTTTTTFNCAYAMYPGQSGCGIPTSSTLTSTSTPYQSTTRYPTYPTSSSTTPTITPNKPTSPAAEPTTTQVIVTTTMD